MGSTSTNQEVILSPNRERHPATNRVIYSSSRFKFKKKKTNSLEIFRDLDSEFVAIYDTNQTSELTVVFSLTWIENDITSELIFFYCGTHLTLESMFRIFSIMMTRMRMMMTYSWWRRYSKKDIRNQVAPVLYASIQSVHLFSKLLFRFSISSSLMDSFVRNHFTGGSWTVPYAPAHFLSIFFPFSFHFLSFYKPPFSFMNYW